MTLPGVLGRQVGPFPVAGWLAIGGAGIGLGLVIRRAMPKDEPLPTHDESDGSGVVATPGGAGGYQTLPTSVAGGGYGQPPVASPSATGSTITTNTEWARRAIQYLIDRNYSPLVATQAITRYLDQQALTAEQQALLIEALRGVGTPPEYVPSPITETPTATTPPAPAPAPVTDGDEEAIKAAFRQYLGREADGAGLAYWLGLIRTGTLTRDAAVKRIADSDEAFIRSMYLRYLGREPDGPGMTYWRGLLAAGTPRSTVEAHFAGQGRQTGDGVSAPVAVAGPRHHTVRAGDNLGKIAKDFYGSPVYASRIYDANRSVIGPNPNLIKPGQVLVIPY